MDSRYARGSNMAIALGAGPEGWAEGEDKRGALTEGCRADAVAGWWGPHTPVALTGIMPVAATGIMGWKGAACIMPEALVVKLQL